MSVSHLSGSFDVPGPIVGWQIFKWEHICVSMEVNDELALRNFTLDGKSYLNSSSSGIFHDTLWTNGYNMTFGGREGVRSEDSAFDGYITDVQVFSRTLSKEEMANYTLCNQVLLKD